MSECPNEANSVQIVTTRGAPGLTCSRRLDRTSSSTICYKYHPPNMHKSVIPPTNSFTVHNLHCNHGRFTKNDREEPTNCYRNEYVLLLPLVWDAYIVWKTSSMPLLPPRTPTASTSIRPTVSVVVEQVKWVVVSLWNIGDCYSRHALPRKDCFIGLVGCFICFGRLTLFLPKLRSRWKLNHHLQNAARFGFLSRFSDVICSVELLTGLLSLYWRHTLCVSQLWFPDMNVDAYLQAALARCAAKAQKQQWRHFTPWSYRYRPKYWLYSVMSSLMVRMCELYL
jgi:hypothetical protein